MLVLLTAIMLMLTTLSNFVTRSTTSHFVVGMILLGMPGLFAAGVGGLLVGQEKDQRTLQWLSSLPIPSRHLISVKLGAAIFGLVLIWIASGVLYNLFSLDKSIVDLQRFAIIVWMAHSLFVLITGLALAWRFESPMLSLMLIIPFAALPRLIISLFSCIYGRMVGRSLPFHDGFPWWIVGLNLICSVVALGFVWRNAHRALSPAISQSVGRWTSITDRYQSASDAAGYRRVQQPAPALLWQFATQNLWLLAGIVGMFLAGLISFSLAGRKIFGNSVEESTLTLFGYLFVLLATAWLGLIVFQSDNLRHRVQFLADRGVTPSLVWLTRHAVPIVILLLFLVIAWFTMWLQVEDNKLALALLLSPTFLATLVVFFIAYVSAQWAGQVIPSPIVSVIAAPLVTIVFIIFTGYATTMFGTPRWLWFLAYTIPIIATLSMMRRWMDRRFGWTYWISHAGMLGLFMFLPIVPFLIEAAQQPKMPDPIAASLDQIAKEALKTDQVYFELVGPGGPSAVNRTREDQVRSINLDIEAFVFESITGKAGNTGSAARSDATQGRASRASSFSSVKRNNEPSSEELFCRDIERQLDENPGNQVSAASSRMVHHLRVIATMARVSLDIEPNDTEALTQYPRVIGLIDRISGQLRKSHDLVEQDEADRWDIWLLQELKRDSTSMRLGESLTVSILERLANRETRNAARRTALAVSWARFRNANSKSWFGIGQRKPNSSRWDRSYFGGYDLVDQKRTVGTSSHLLTEKRLGVDVADLWELLHSQPGQVQPELLKRIARFWGQSPSAYGVGDTGVYYRADDVSLFSPTRAGVSWMRQPVASQWSAGWEREAEEMFANSNSNKGSNP